MATSTLNVRMDADVKKRLDQFCANVGMTTTTAVNLFARAVLREDRIPFEITAERPHNDLPFLTPEGGRMLREDLEASEAYFKNGGKGYTVEETLAHMREAKEKEKKLSDSLPGGGQRGIY
jgi:DNA-damage-inducible protein J